MTNQEALKKCICFCALCEKGWRQNERKVWEIKTAIAVCAACDALLCEDHSFILRGRRRCRDRDACRALVPDHDEGGGS